MLTTLLARALQVPSTTKGSDLYAECKTFITAADNPRSHPGSFDSGECLGYIGGVGDVSVGMHVACMGKATTGTVARVYIAYMDKNPKLFDEPRSTGLLQAITEAYPCTK